MKGGEWYEADDVRIGDMWTNWYPFFNEILVPFYLHSFGLHTTFQCEPDLSEVTRRMCGEAGVVSRWWATFVEKEGWKQSIARREIRNWVHEFIKVEAEFVKQYYTVETIL